jgi:pimeloyl-ACP methyl ester carboxylesterase
MTEAEALRDLAARELSALPRGIGEIHRAISGRVFGALGPAAAPVRVMHDTIARGVYTSLSTGLRLTSLVPVSDTELSETRRGAMALGALNGLLGDKLDEPLAIPMAVRRVGEPATPRLAVFLHGLGETEYAWGSPSYGERLHDDLGITPVFVRFNTGRHISENGASLAALLDEVVASWPVEVEQMALIGHSMGGLVARSACHHGGAWTALVRHTVSLGTPHSGAPLEQAVHAMSSALHLVPETRPFARFLRRRSAGIRDLRRGVELPPFEGPTHHFVAATVTRTETHPVGRLIGDTLVLVSSASAGLDAANGLALGSTHHLALLNHPEVYDRLRSWL